MIRDQFLITCAILDKYYPILRELMCALAEQNIKGEITRHTEVGSITFKL